MKLAKELQTEIGVMGGAAAFAPQVEFAGVVAQGFEGQLSPQGEVVRGGAVAHLAVIFAKGHVEHPMAAVLLSRRSFLAGGCQQRQLAARFPRCDRFRPSRFLP